MNQVPWDRAAYSLYLCVYAFERSICSRSPTVVEVDRALLGELADDGDTPSAGTGPSP